MYIYGVYSSCVFSCDLQAGTILVLDLAELDELNSTWIMELTIHG